MLNIKSLNNQNKYQSFGISSGKEKATQRQAQELEKLAKQAKSEDRSKNAFRSFAIIAALTTASTLTGAAVAGRVFNVVNGLGGLKKIAPKLANGVDYLAEKSKNINVKNAGKVKKALIEGYQKSIKYVEELSTSGVEEKIAALKKSQSGKMLSIKKAVLKKNPELKGQKDKIKQAVQQAIDSTPEYKEFLDNITKQIQDLKGSNLFKKMSKTTSATVMGAGALKEATRDTDGNGIPDCAEYRRANKETTQKLTTAIIDAALDNI